MRLKFGIDFRRLSPQFDPVEYTQGNYFIDVPSTEMGTTLLQHADFQPSRHFAVSQSGHLCPRYVAHSFTIDLDLRI